MRIVFTTVAQDDLRAIGDYIAQDNPLRAYNFIAEIKGACLSLEYHPRRFPSRRDTPTAPSASASSGAT